MVKTLKDEIVEALRDAAPYLDEKSEAMINKLAAKVESARCENCHWFNIVKPTCCDNPKNDNGFDDGAWIEANGPEFFCWHFEPKEKK